MTRSEALSLFGAGGSLSCMWAECGQTSSADRAGCGWTRPDGARVWVNRAPRREALSGLGGACGRLPGVAVGEVLVDPGSAAAPLAVVAALGAKPAALGGGAQGDAADLWCLERGEWHESGGSGQCRHDEPVEVVQDCSGDQLGQGAVVAGVGPPQGLEVPRPLALLDDRRGVAETGEDQVEQQSTCSAVPVEEGVDLLEADVGFGESFHRVARGPGDGVDQVQPVAQPGLDQREGGWAHPTGEGADVVLAEVPGRLVRRGVGVRADAPDGPQRHAVDVPDLGERQELTEALEARLEGLAVDPSCGVRVALDLHVLGELAVADCATLEEKLLDLTQDQRVPFDRGGVVRLVDPQLVPDRPRLGRRRESAEAIPYLGDRGIEALVDLLARGSTRPADDDVAALRHIQLKHSNFSVAGSTHGEVAASVPNQLERSNYAGARGVPVGSIGPMRRPAAPRPRLSKRRQRLRDDSSCTDVSAEPSQHDTQ